MEHAGVPAAGCGERRLKTWARGAFRATRRSVRLLSRAAYYLLPPAVYEVLKCCAPRICRGEARAQFVAAVKRRFTSPPPPAVQAPAGPPDVLPLVAPPAAPPPDPEAERILAHYRDVYCLPEYTARDSKHKAERYRAVAGDTRLDRVRLFREIARLEADAGNVLTACLYRLRALRLLGRDDHGDLEWLAPRLTEAGYGAEAEAARAMYGPERDRDRLIGALLARAAERCRAPEAPCDFTAFEDRRGAEPPRVAVIASLYNAAAKLPTFLKALQLQTLNRAGRMELILIDSASPADEHAALAAAQLEFPIPCLYARTPARETIQTAWNRAIGLARAPYLTFLGADEALVPDALAALAAELDADTDLDWVQADSLVTAVDRHGLLERDVRTYDRAGLTRNLVHLETCYLSSVGAMHRKSVHERFGWYDGTFRGAGDTEFKCRVVPRLKVKRLARMLGQFLDYPEDRTTASPAAEIEDTRAWYLHRTAAGLRRAFADRPNEELADLLTLSLRHRKSYNECGSSDVELADAAARVLRERDPSCPALALADGAARLLAAYRAIDHLPTASHGRLAQALRDARRAIAEVQRQHRATPWLPDAAYEIINDNRHEQHCWLWW